MALPIISVAIFTVFFSEALTLTCYNCSAAVPLGTCSQTANCTQNEQCSITNKYNESGYSTMNCNAFCANWSLNAGWMNYVSRCCASDLCNSTEVSFNGKMCYTCNDTNCSSKKTIDCKGTEDKCLTGTATVNGNNVTLKGCASNTFCVNSTVYLSGQVFNVSCEDAGLRDSACLARGAMLLLVPVLPLLFYI